MNPYISIISQFVLFQGMEQSDIVALLHCSDATYRKYLKDETILYVGQTINKFGIVLEGTAKISKDSIYGDEYFLSELEVLDMFAESFVYAKVKQCPVNVTATSDCTILFLSIHSNQQHNYSIQQTMNQRMLHILAEKNIALQNKNELLSQRTIRDKVLHYLEREANLKGMRQIEITFDRKELADYICVDRASLSRELAKMQSDGILSYHLNTFLLLGKQEDNG